MNGAPLYQESREHWEVQPSLFISDTQSNRGYLLGLRETNKGFPMLAFDVGSGRRSIVRYIGRVYDATTPEKQWEVKSLHIKGDRITFGKTGSFLRLYDSEGQSTPYGIHATSNIDTILSMPPHERYVSMGCILVSNELLSLLIDTYQFEEGALMVQTINGVSQLGLSVPE